MGLPDNERPALPAIPTPRPVGEHLIAGTSRMNAASGGGVAIIASVLIAAFLPGTALPLWVTALGGLLLLGILLAVLAALASAVAESRLLHGLAQEERKRFEQERADRLEERQRLAEERAKPVVEAVIEPFYPYSKARCVLIVNWPQATALPMGATVLISTAEETHERPLGTGCVRPQQDNGRHVVTLDAPGPDSEVYIKALLAEGTRVACAARLRIGPAYDLQSLSERSSSASSGRFASSANEGQT